MESPAVLGEAAGVIAILKPAGLATQAPAGIPSVEAWVRHRLHAGDPAGYLGVPHRLDRAVSGVLLMAATPRAARKLSRQFERRQVAKTYLAVVPIPAGGGGLSAAATAEWRDLVEKIPDQARGRIAAAPAGTAREAVTQVRIAATGPAPSGEMLLRMEPLTGRMHQLRIQSAARGMPIVGDDLYGGGPIAAGDSRAPAILLHAWRIAYTDPDGGERITIEAPLPDHWPAWARDEGT